MKKTLSLLLVLGMLFSAYAQPKQVTGKVTDINGNPVLGISVTIKGTSRGTTTAINDTYKLTAPENGVLVLSGVGFEPQEVAIRSRSALDVQLTAEARTLSEVIVTGTGVATEKKKLSIDVSSVANKDLTKSAFLSI